MKIFKCLFGHDWVNFQHCFKTDDRNKDGHQYCIVIAFKICHRCAKSKLIHILE